MLARQGHRRVQEIHPHEVGRFRRAAVVETEKAPLTATLREQLGDAARGFMQELGEPRVTVTARGKGDPRERRLDVKLCFGRR